MYLPIEHNNSAVILTLTKSALRQNFLHVNYTLHDTSWGQMAV